MRLLRTTKRMRFETGEKQKLIDQLETEVTDDKFDFFTVNKIYHGTLDPHYEVVIGEVYDLEHAVRKSEQRRA